MDGTVVEPVGSPAAPAGPAGPAASGALARAVCVADLRRLARRRLPRAVFDFIDGGAGDERTLRANEEAFADWRLLPRVAVDVSRRTAGTGILGHASRLPLVLAPTGLAGLFHPDGEAAAARAAAAAGVPFCLSTNSVASIEEVAAAAGRTERWFQLYFLKDRDWMASLVNRARAADYRVLCVTLDLPITGRRERDQRNGFTMPLRPTPRNLLDLALRPRWLLGALRSPVRFGNFEGLAPSGITSVASHVATLFDPSATWDDVARLRDAWPGPVVVKGILHPDDAVRAVTLGADAVIVSNHGGRQLDQVPASLEALPAVVGALAGRAEVILDGGVRRGTDVLTALALGASACMIGRAFLWGLSAGGQAGVARTLRILADEIDTAMALLGVDTVAALGRDHLRPAGRTGYDDS
ncbi:alpha-hydroxy acid oxidase, partial [Arenibaculum sp.]|uniref:alpha-hydroxy acid oxidase n=1 Tax=Arenibaculum sp. TaxID=2865862 RepID=UPI002E15AFFD|nr:alpha-hydroxy acid oxidase [Arenibaculum sp.]